MLLVYLTNWYEQQDMERDVFAPIGPAYLAASLEAAGFSTETVTYRFMPADLTLKKILNDRKPKVLAISATGNEIPILKKLTREVKAICVDLPIIVGGYCSLEGETLLENSCIDILVIGEGEQTIVDLANHFLKQHSIDDINGIVYRISQNEIIRNPPREVLKDIDQLPVPTYSHIPPNTESIRVYASRGCPFQCGFCEIKDFYAGKGIRYHSAAYMRRLIGRLECQIPNKVKYVYFNDDEFLLSVNHLKSMGNLMRDLGFKMVFQTRVRDILKHWKYIEYYHDVIHEIHLGVESFSDSQLKRWKKATTAEQNRKALQILAELSVSYYPYLILSDDETTPRELFENCDGIINMPECPFAIVDGKNNLRVNISPLHRGIHLNRLKDSYGNFKRNASTKYLEKVWSHITLTEREYRSLNALFLKITILTNLDSDKTFIYSKYMKSLPRLITNRIKMIAQIGEIAYSNGELDIQAISNNFCEESRMTRATLLSELHLRSEI